MTRFYNTLFVPLLSFAPLLEPGTAFAGQMRNHLDGNVSNVLAATPAFYGSYSAAPTQAQAGQAITLQATLTDTSISLLNGNVTLEVRDSSNQKIFQKFFPNQSMTSGQKQSYQAVWIPNSPGTYTYQVGVFDRTWTTAYLWDVPARLTVTGNQPPPPPTPPPPNNRQTDSSGWVACSSNFVPLSDGQASAMVVPAAENRPGNTAANHYWPSGAELSAFRNGETDRFGRTAIRSNPYSAYVTGGYSGTTDQIIQWVAAKWGIPADWLRAVAVSESRWNQSQRGDLTAVANPWRYPSQSQAGGNMVYQSLGIAQVKWNHPDRNDAGIGTEPLRWKSTAFNVDYMAANVRFFFDNPNGSRSAWGDAYWPCDHWLSIGAYYLPFPWNNSGQQGYGQHIQSILNNRTWAQPGF